LSFAVADPTVPAMANDKSKMENEKWKYLKISS
jgi:hypothetical protein